MSVENERVDVDRIVQDIREKVRARVVLSRSDSPPLSGIRVPLENTPPIVADLNSTIRDIETQGLLLGQPTPAPRTVRGRVGAWVVRLLARTLWWYTYQLREFSLRVVRLFREQSRALEAISRDMQRIERLESALSEMGGAITAVRSQAQALASRLEQPDRAAAEVVKQTGILNAKLERASSGVRELTETAALESVLTEIRAQIQSLAAGMDALSKSQGLLAQRCSELGLFTYQTRSQCSIQDRRISLLFQEIRQKSLPGEISQFGTSGDASKLDALYAAFEDVYRGTTEEIKARQSVYLPILQEHGSGSQHPVLDVGCGRGEWLQLLRENGIAARGVDRNQEMIARCRGVDLDVVHADAFDYMRGLPPGSLSMVTAFHFVEHLPFDSVIELVDECLRVLRPGGILIFETPNPQNLQVGAHTFYLDPTHLRPLPSGMLRFFVEARGFFEVYVRDLHPYPSPVLLPEDENPCAARFNNMMYGCQDYAVIGRRP